MSRSVSVPAWLPRWGLLLLALVGWGLFARAMLINVIGTISLSGEEIGGMGVDTYAYWLAGANLLVGDALYWVEDLGVLGGYRYPPPFAQAWMPLSLLPEVVIDWGWRLLGVFSVRYMAGSWQIAGLWWLFPGSIVEITAGNVTFQVAALTVAGLRGRAEMIFPAALIKFSAVAVAPFLWFHRPETRRSLLVGAAVAAVIVAISVVASPGLWRDWFSSIGGQGGFSFEGMDIIHVMPTPAADFLLRAAIAAVVVIASVRFDSPHLAYVAAFLLTPTLWVQRFSVLFALLTLENDDWLKPYRWPWQRDIAPDTQSVPEQS